MTTDYTCGDCVSNYVAARRCDKCEQPLCGGCGTSQSNGDIWCARCVIPDWKEELSLVLNDQVDRKDLDMVQTIHYQGVCIGELYKRIEELKEQNAALEQERDTLISKRKDDPETLDGLRAQLAQLRSQLPEGMKNCKILLLECEKGHSRLTASNWLYYPCLVCEINAARVVIDHLRAEEETSWQAAENSHRCRENAERECNDLKDQLASAEADIYDLEDRLSSDTILLSAVAEYLSDVDLLLQLSKHPKPIVREGAVYGLAQQVYLSVAVYDRLEEMAKSDHSAAVAMSAQEVIDSMDEEEY